MGSIDEGAEKRKIVFILIIILEQKQEIKGEFIGKRVYC